MSQGLLLEKRKTAPERLFTDSSPEEFTLVYNEHAPRLYRHVLSRTGSREAAEDIAAQTFLNAWEYLQRSEAAIENVRAFLYRIAQNLVTDYYRGKHLAAVPLETLPEHHRALRAPQDIAERLEEKDTLHWVEEALASLSEEYRTVVAWRYIDELSIEEIVEISGKTRNTIYVTLHRALKKMRVLLKEQGL